MNLNELRSELIRLGAVQRLLDLDKERNALLKLLGRTGDTGGKAKEIITGIKSNKKKWTKQQRAKFKATMAAKRGTK
jgi:hypothetical protein